MFLNALYPIGVPEVRIYPAVNFSQATTLYFIGIDILCFMFFFFRCMVTSVLLRLKTDNFNFVSISSNLLEREEMGH